MCVCVGGKRLCGGVCMEDWGVAIPPGLLRIGQGPDAGPSELDTTFPSPPLPPTPRPPRPGPNRPGQLHQGEETLTPSSIDLILLSTDEDHKAKDFRSPLLACPSKSHWVVVVRPDQSSAVPAHDGAAPPPVAVAHRDSISPYSFWYTSGILPSGESIIFTVFLAKSLNS